MIQRNWKLSSLKPQTIFKQSLPTFSKNFSKSHTTLLSTISNNPAQKTDHRGNQSWNSGTSNFKQSLLSINYHPQPKISPKIPNQMNRELSKTLPVVEADFWHNWWSLNLNLANLNRPQLQTFNCLVSKLELNEERKNNSRKDVWWSWSQWSWSQKEADPVKHVDHYGFSRAPPICVLKCKYDFLTCDFGEAISEIANPPKNIYLFIYIYMYMYRIRLS